MIRATSSIVSLIAAAAFVTSQASAVTWTETGTTPASWNVGANWGGPFPNAVDAVADMNVNVTVNQTVNLNQAITVGALNLGDTDSSNTLTIAPNTGSLTFDVFAGNAAVTKAASTNGAPDLISAPVVLSDNLAVTVNSVFNSTSTAGGLRLSGGISDGGSALGITKEGPGTLSIQGGAANTYTGPTVVHNGTLVVETANSIPNASPISVIATGAGEQAVLRWGLWNAGVADTIGSLTLGGTTTTSRPVVNMSYNQTLTITGNVTFDATNNPLGALLGSPGGSPAGNMSVGSISLGGGTRTFNVGNSSSDGLDLQVRQAIGNGSIVKTGAGTLYLGAGAGLTNVWVKQGDLYGDQPGQLGASVTIGDSTGSNNIVVTNIRGGNTNFVVGGGNTGTATISGHWGHGSGSQAWSGTIQLGDVNGAHDLTIQSTNVPVFRGNISGTGDLTLNSNGFTLTWDQTSTSINHSGAINHIGGGTVQMYAAIGPNVTAVNKTGTGVLNLRGVNTYTGDTTISAGTLTLFDNAGLLFDIGLNGINNSILGVGTASLNGDFYFDLTSAGMNLGDSWNIVDVATLNETFGSTFTVNGFTDIGGNQWEFISGPTTYTFSESTGMLVVTAAASAVPEPSTLGLAALGMLSIATMLVRRKRK